MDLLILAAGKGSRMNSSLPKALHETLDNNNINNIYEKCSGLFDNIYVAINHSNEKVFKDNINENIGIISISSGLGSGHAVLESIKSNKDLSSEFCLIWGDAVIFDSDIVEELIAYPSNFAIPVLQVDNPYVSFKCDSNLRAKSVDFSKYGETNSKGLQDKCIFKLDKNILLNALQNFHSCTYKDGRYITESSEFEFLYVIHLLSLTENVQCYITDKNSIFSYNTQEELITIKEQYGK
ncbi:MAG: NTP transferase domain-containing protein [Sulfuricurvum sp.]